MQFTDAVGQRSFMNVIAHHVCASGGVVTTDISG